MKLRINFDNQIYPCDSLKKYAERRQQNIIISGNEGCGKTHLARQYSVYLGIRDFIIVKPTVDELTSTMEALIGSQNDVCLCIENLDTAVIGASYSILKFLEEPPKNVFIVITCRNINRIPYTILSRCPLIDVHNPTKDDIMHYCSRTDIDAYNRIKNHLIYNCIKTFSDANIVLGMDADKLQYFEKLPEIMKCNDTVSNISYKLSHYPDKSKSDICIVLRYIMWTSDDKTIWKYVIGCTDDIRLGRVADWCAVAVFAMRVKNYVCRESLCSTC